MISKSRLMTPSMRSMISTIKSKPEVNSINLPTQPVKLSRQKKISKTVPTSNSHLNSNKLRHHLLPRQLILMGIQLQKRL
jgi:hypothetical protein